MKVDGPSVKLLRHLRGLSAEDFASRIGKSASYLRDIEAGKRKLNRNVELRDRIQAELAVPLHMIWVGSDDFD